LGSKFAGVSPIDTVPPGLQTSAPMKSMINLLALATLSFAAALLAQPNTSAVAATAGEYRLNVATVPVARTGGITNRQALVLQRAKDAPGEYDVEFIGDSITQGWEGVGKNVWAKLGEKYKVINFGVGGDRTEHVLWRFEQGQLTGIKAKAAVVMIGTNNSNKNRDGSDQYSELDIVEGVTAIVNQIRTRQSETKIILCAIFPRSPGFSAQRGRLCQINQALAKLDDGKNIFFLDFGAQFIEKDGTLPKSIMPDALHPNEAGYKIWAAAIEPKLKEIVGK